MHDQVSDKDMIVIAAMLAVPKVLPKLDLLRLDENDIGASGASYLAQAIACGSSDALASVTKLFLQRNRLGNIGLKQLTPALISGGLPQLTELHLAYNGIGDGGVEKFAGALAKGALPLLEVLNLSRNAIGDAGCSEMASAALAEPTAPSSPDADEGAAPAASGEGVLNERECQPRKPLGELRCLYLVGNQISDAGGAALGEALQKVASMPRLEQLHLGTNPISPPMRGVVEAAGRARPPPRPKVVLSIDFT